VNPDTIATINKRGGRRTGPKGEILAPGETKRR
jgi:hypothetical protein